MKKVVVFILVVALITGLAGSVVSASSIGDYVTVINTGNIGLSFRSGPSLSYAKIGNNKEGTRVKIVDGPRSANGYTWWKIQSPAGTGWSAGYYLSSGSSVILPEIPTVNIGVGGNGVSSGDPGPNQAVFYMDHNFEGRYVILNVGDYSNPDKIGLPNDNISSVKLGKNVRVVLYEHDNFSGRSESFSSNEYDLVDNHIGNDVVSSLKVISTIPAINQSQSIDLNSIGEATDAEVIQGIKESYSTTIYKGVTYIDGWPSSKFEELCNKDAGKAGQVLQQIVCNNYTRVSTPEGAVSQIVISFVGLDLGADAVNLYYDATHARWTLRWFGQTTIDGISLLPVMGGLKTLAVKAVKNDWWITAAEKKLAEESLDSYLKKVTKIEELVDLSKFETKNGYRTGFKILNPSMLRGFQVHHTLPQEYRDWFAKNGINVDQMKYLRGVAPHIHDELTARWRKFGMIFGRTPPVEQIQKFADILEKRYSNYYHVEEFSIRPITKINSGLIIAGDNGWTGGSVEGTIIPGTVNNTPQASETDRRSMIIQSYRNIFWCPPDEAQISGWLANSNWRTIADLEREHRIWITDHTIPGFNESQARSDFISLFKELLKYDPDRIAIEWNVLQMKIGTFTLSDIRARIIAGMPKPAAGNTEDRRNMIIQSYRNIFWCPPDEAQISGWLANSNWRTVADLEKEHRIWITDHTIPGFNESQARADFISLFKELLKYEPDQTAIEWNVLQMKIGSLTLKSIRERIIAGMPK